MAKQFGLGMGSGRPLGFALAGHVIADVNQVVSDHSESDPSLHAAKSFIAGPPQPMPAFEDADAALAASPPFLQFLKPPLLLLFSALLERSRPRGGR